MTREKIDFAEIAPALAAEWRKAVRKEAKPATIARIATTLEAKLRAVKTVRAAEREGKLATEQLLAEVALAPAAKKLHRFATRYNWDDGVETMQEVVEDEACAMGTALLVYWLARPHFYRQFTKRAEAEPYQRPHWDLLRRIEQRLKATDEDRLFHLDIVFDPQTWQPDYDWTKDVYKDLPKRDELPPHVWIRTTKLGVEPIHGASLSKKRSSLSAS